MKNLLISATTYEIAPLLSYCSKPSHSSFFALSEKVDCLISGVGLLNTAIQLQQILHQNNYDFVIQAGVAGSYDATLDLGELVEVVQDQIGDIGAEDRNGHFLSLEKMNLSKAPIYKNESHFNLPNVKAISVNQVAGSTETIEQRRNLFEPQIETMEGAAFFAVCEQFEVEYSQIRAISNRVELRNRESWKIDLAIDRLCEFLKTLLSK